MKLKYKHLVILMSLFAAGLSGNASAQGAPTLSDMDNYRNSSPEQKMQMRTELKQNNPEEYQKVMQLRSELKELPPEERKARLEEIKGNLDKSRIENRNAFEDRWQQASPQARTVFCSKAQEKCSGGEVKACEIVQNQCK